MKENNTISACIVSYNDAKQIEKCLHSLQGVVDEIILTHDGECTDKTLQIAKKYKATIWIRPNKGFAEPHRAEQYKKAKGKWILILDPDEYLSPSLRKNLRKIVASDDADGYFFLWRMWDGKKYLTKKWPYRIGVVKKTHLRYLGIQHTDWTPRGRLKLIDHELYHRPNYDNNSWSTFRTKHLPWLHLHAKQILTPIDQIPQFQWNSDKFPKHIEWIKRFHIFASPFIFVYFFVGSFVLSFPTEGFKLIRWVFFQALYYFLLCFAVAKLKYEKK